MSDRSAIEHLSPRWQFVLLHFILLFFCLLYSTFLLTIFYFPVAENYIFTRDSKVKLIQYSIPRDLIIRNNLNPKQGLFTEFVLKENVVQSFECNRLDLPANKRNICNIFMDKNNKFVSVSMYQRHMDLKFNNKITDYKTKAISYLNSENKLIEIVYSVGSIEGTKTLKNSWNKLIFFNIFIDIIGMVILLIVYFIKYPKVVEYNKSNRIGEWIFYLLSNVPKFILVLYVVTVMVYVWYYVLSL